jgi:cyclic di-GMP phosphodiesterase Gmr
MLELKEDMDDPLLFTHFGTANPFWKLTTDSNTLQLSGQKEEFGSVGIELTAVQANLIRNLSGAMSSKVLDVPVFGNRMRLHLVGRKIDAWEWGGNAARYGDTEAVARDLGNGLSFAEQVISEVNSLVIIIDSAGKVKRFNRMCEEVTGVSEESIVGKNAHALFMPEEVRAESWQAVGSFFQKQETYEVTRPLHTLKGTRIIHWRTKIMRSGTGVDEAYLVCSGTDVTEEQAAKARLLELANSDVLTGLPNRHSIEENINAAFNAEEAQPFGLIFLDLDDFKTVNDHYGHVTGDVLLKQVSTAIREVLAEGDVLARFGGDEFLVKVAASCQDDVEAAAVRILARMAKPFSLPRAEVHTGCSIGIAMFPQHGTTLEDLVRSADTAMYVAKAAGRKTYRVFTAAMNDRVAEYIWLETNMRRALSEEQFELYYQPKVCLESGKIDGVEALVRWNHPERGLVSPATFIPYSEDSGLIVQLGKWVINAAARQAGLWKEQGLDLRIAINLSPRQLRVESLVEDFKQAIHNNGVSPSMVDLELTESCLVDDERTAQHLIKMFQELGAQVHLDDFGTGYSSLSQLARLPFDVLKLDGSFIHSIHTDAKAQALVRSMVAVGHELSLKIVAECVETEDQATFLQKIGVDFAQGYLFGKPMKAFDFEAWLASLTNGRYQRTGW